MDVNQIANYLDTIPHFRDLDENERCDLAKLFEVKTFVDKQVLCSEDTSAEHFYVITSGQVQLERGRGREKRYVGTLIRGDILGHESLLYNHKHKITGVCRGGAKALVLEKKNFQHMLLDFPEIEDDLQILARSYRIARKEQFNWMEEGEIIHMIAQKHIYVLLSSLLPSLTLFAIGAIFVASGLLAASPGKIGGILLKVIGLLIAVPSIFWAIWKWVDWGNDFYIVTNKRVIWLEKIVMLFESRNEAPLNAIISIDTNKDYIQKLWKSADVVVRTLKGDIVMENVDRPEQFKAMINAYWQRLELYAEEEAHQKRVETIRTVIGLQQPPEVEQQSKDSSQPTKKNSKLTKWFSNLLKTHIEEEGDVIYRKHWFILLREIWLIVVIFLGLSGYLVLQVGLAYASGENPLQKALMPLAAMGIFLLLSSPWWLYHLIDWSNDIYKVTDKKIFDIDRKPLGRERTQSAPLERVLNTSVEQNFIQKLLNYGTVLINVGEAEFTFDNVYNPTMVQQEVFQRFQSRQQTVEEQKAQRERDQMAEWLSIYHEQAQNGKSSGHRPDFN